MNRELKILRARAAYIEQRIEENRPFTQNTTDTKVDDVEAHWTEMLNDVQDQICDMVIEDSKRPLWKKLFRK